MKNYHIIFILLLFNYASFSQDHQLPKYPIDKLFISSQKTIISTGPETSVKGKSAYIYFNNSYVVVYFEDTKKPPSVYKIKFWDEHIDSTNQTLTIWYVHFDNLKNEAAAFNSYKIMGGNRIDAPQPDITFGFVIPIGNNKNKYVCDISYNAHQYVSVNIEGKLNKSRNEEMEKIIEKALAKEKTINNNRLNVGDEYRSGVIIQTNKIGQHGIICTKIDIANSISYKEALSIADTFKLGNRKWRLPNTTEAEYIRLLKVGIFKSFNYWIKYPNTEGMVYQMGTDGGQSAFWGAKYKGYTGEKGVEVDFSRDIGLRLVSEF